MGTINCNRTIGLMNILIFCFVFFSCKTNRKIVSSEGSSQQKSLFLNPENKALVSRKDLMTSKSEWQQFKIAAVRKKKNLASYRSTAETLLVYGDLKGAESFAKKALNVDFRDVRSKVVLAHVAYLMDNPLRAEAILYNISTIPGSETSESMNLLGCILLKQGRFTQAIQSFEKAIKKNSDNVAPLANLGIVHLKRYQPAYAEKYLRSALLKAPDHPDLLLNLGVAYSMQGKLREAKDSYAKISTVHHNKPIYIYNYAVLKMKLGNPQGALRDLQGLKKSGQSASITSEIFYGFDREVRSMVVAPTKREYDDELDQIEIEKSLPEDFPPEFEESNESMGPLAIPDGY
jgi:Flp pilus assembly protein TadD